jgi:hypothetical protein
MSTPNEDTAYIRPAFKPENIDALRRALRNEWSHVWTLREEAMQQGETESANECQILLEQIEGCRASLEIAVESRRFWRRLAAEAHKQ